MQYLTWFLTSQNGQKVFHWGAQRWGRTRDFCLHKHAYDGIFHGIFGVSSCKSLVPSPRVVRDLVTARQVGLWSFKFGRWLFVGCGHWTVGEGVWSLVGCSVVDHLNGIYTEAANDFSLSHPSVLSWILLFIYFPLWFIYSISHEYCWWASSSDMLIYPSIFAFPSLSLHHWSTTMHLCSDATTCNHTHFIRLILLIWWTHDLRFTCIYFYS